MILRVTAPHFVAGALWEHGSCVRAAPIIAWMFGAHPQAIKSWLVRNGYAWEWLREPSTGRDGSAQSFAQASGCAEKH